MTKVQKIVTGIVSLIGAFLLWAYVITFVNPVTDVPISNIPIQVLNADTLTKNGYILTGVSNTTTTVTVSGSRSDVSGITADDILVTLDVGGYREGDNSIRVNVSAPTSVTVKDIRNNGRVTAHIEQLVSETKPYEFLYAGSVRDGYEMGFLTLDPDVVTVTGAKSVVETVEKLRVILDLTQLRREGYSFESAIAPTSAADTEVKDVTLSAKRLSGRAYLCEVADVPLSVTVSGQLPEGFELAWEAEPRVHVRSAALDLSALESIPTEPVNASLLTEAGVDVTLVPVLPAAVEYAEEGGPVKARLLLVPIPEEPVEDGTDGENADEGNADGGEGETDGGESQEG